MIFIHDLEKLQILLYQKVAIFRLHDEQLSTYYRPIDQSEGLTSPKGNHLLFACFLNLQYEFMTSPLSAQISSISVQPQSHALKPICLLLKCVFIWLHHLLLCICLGQNLPHQHFLRLSIQSAFLALLLLNQKYQTRLFFMEPLLQVFFVAEFYSRELLVLVRF